MLENGSNAGLYLWLASGGDISSANQKYTLILQLSQDGCCLEDDLTVEGTLAEVAQQVNIMHARLQSVSMWQSLDGPPVINPVPITIGVLGMGVLSLDGGPEAIEGHDPRVCLIRDIAAGTARDISPRVAQLS